MAGDEGSCSSLNSGGSNGGARAKGIMNANTQNQVNKDRKIIQQAWNIATVEDAFPESIKPLSLGQSALTNLRSIAKRVPNLAAAQVMFLDVAKNSKGAAIPFGFKSTTTILEQLKADDTQTPNSTPDDKRPSKNGSTPKTANAIPKANITPKTNATPTASTSMAPVSQAKKLHDLIAPGVNVKAPFSIANANTPPKKEPVAIMTTTTPEPQKPPLAKKMTKKRPAAPGVGESQEPAKKLRVSETPALGPKKVQHNTMSLPKSATELLKVGSIGKVNHYRRPNRLIQRANSEPQDIPIVSISHLDSAKDASPQDTPMQDVPIQESPAPTQDISIVQPKSAFETVTLSNQTEPNNEYDDDEFGSCALAKLMAEHRIRSVEFFARSEALMALWGTDTIRVVIPPDQQDTTASLDHVPKKAHKRPTDTMFSKTYLKDECMKLSDAVQRVIGVDTIHKLATPEQLPLVDEVKRVLNHCVARMQTDLEFIFATADTE